MEPNTNQLSQLFEGLSATGVRTTLWDEDDNLLHADPGMLEIYQNEEFNEKFGKVELTEGMSWRKWTAQEITLGIIEVPEDLDQESFLNKMEKERQDIKDRRSRELTFKNGVTVLSTDIRLKDGGLFTSFTDITEQKQNNEKLMSLSKALDSTGNTTFIFDKDGKFVYGNKSFHDLQNSRGLPVHEGMTHDEWLRRLVEKGIFTVPEGVTAEEHLANRKAMRDNIDHQYITETGRSDGTWILDTTTRLDDGGFITVVSDITDYKKQAKELRESNAKNAVLSEAMNKSSNGIIISDKNDKFIFTNTFVKENSKKSGIVITEEMHYIDYVRQMINAGVVKLPDDISLDDFLSSRIENRAKITTEEVRELNTETMGTRLLTETRLDDGGLLTISTDITDLKSTNDKLSVLTEAMDKSSNGIWIFDKDERLIFANEQVRATARDAGFEPKVGMKYQDYLRLLVKAQILSTGETLDEEQFIKQRAAQRVKIKEFEITERRTAKGTSLLTTTRLDNGGLVTVSSDITELKASSEKISVLSNAMDKSSAGIWVFDREDKFLFGNAKFYQNMQQSGVEVKEGMSWSEYITLLINAGSIIPPKGTTKKNFIKERIKIRSSIKEEEVLEAETNIATFLMSTNRLDDGGLVTISTDITDLRRQNEALERLSSAMQEVPNGMMLWDKDDKLVFVNKFVNQVQKKRGIKSFELGDTWIEIQKSMIKDGAIAIPDGKSEKEFLKEIFTSRANLQGQQVRERTTSEGQQFLLTDARLGDGGLVTIVTDVTELKKQEAELQRLRTATDLSSVGSMIWDKDDRLIYANRFVKEQNKEVYGVEIEEGITYSDYARSLMDKGALVVPDDTTLDDFLEKQLKNRALVTYQHDRESESQSFERELGDKTFLSSMVRLQDDSLFQTFADITELKKHELELARLNTATDYSSVGTLIWNKDDVLIYFNRSAHQFGLNSFDFEFRLGASYDEVARRQVETASFEIPDNMTDEEFIAQLKSQRASILYNENEDSVAESFERVVGDDTYLFSYIRLKDGSLFQAFTDITEQKRRESELQRLSDGINSISNGLVFWDENQNLVFCNAVATEFSKKQGFDMRPGVNRLDMRKQFIATGMRPGESGKEGLTENDIQQQLMKVGTTEREQVYSDGTVLLFSDKTFPDGSVISVYTDITERKKREETNSRLTQALERIPNQVMFWDKSGQLILANEKSRKFQSEYGFSMSPGANRLDMRKNLIEKGMINLGETATAPDRWQEELKKLQEKGYSERERVFSNGTVLLFSDTLLPDGSVINFATDITERKKREETNRRLTDALEQIPNGMSFWDTDGGLIQANKKARNLWKSFGVDLAPGQTRAEMREMMLEKDAVMLAEGKSKEQQKAEREKFWQELKSDEVRETEFTNGMTVSFTTTRLTDGSTVVFGTDITERKKREVINNRLNEAIEMIQNGVMFWDKENKLILANQIARDFQSQHGFDLMPGVHRSEMRKAMVAAGLLPKPEVSAEASVEEQRKVLSETGKEIREVTFSNGIVFLFANTMLSDGSVINFFTDITERKKREEVNRRLTEALEQIPNGMSFWDKEDNLIGVNRVLRDLWDKFGVALDIGEPRSSMRDQFLSRNAIVFADKLSKEQRILERQKSWQQIEGQQVRETEFADGTILLFNDTRLKDGSTLSFASDITELKKREKDLELAKIEADEANEAKSQFLANMSHELRTPLNAVIGLTEMLKEDAEDDNLDDYLEPLDRIHSASRHLLTLINDVLDLSKIEAGKIELYFEQFLVSDIMRDIMATSEPLAQKNNNELILENNLVFDSIHSDQTRVRQIVLNLVSNACKFTENGQVTIALDSRMNDDKEFLDIAITDTGIGMSEAQVNKLFQAFTQADSSTTRKYGGTGLGLIITKHLSRIMGGDVDVSSVEGEGTTFTASITINANNADNVEADAIKYDAVVLGDSDKLSSSKAEHMILIIDDDPTVRDLMKRQLERDGFGVLIAEDGPLGIKMAIDTQPDAIVLDILMPGMDGWSVLRTLKASKETASIPVIMASILDEKNRGFSLGAADYLSKPVERDRLISSIEKLIGSGDGKTVFIIEDDDELRFLLREALSKEAYDVIEAENGKVALEELEADVGSPDLILLDLNMPVMNGFEFLEIYREKFGNDVPIVVVTGADLTDKDKKFLSGEVTRILEKTPDTEGTIAGDVAKVLRNVRMG